MLVLAVKLSKGQRVYIGQIDNSVTEFCVESTKITGCGKQSYE